MRTVSNLLEAFGLLGIVAGFALIDWRFGLIALGILLVVVGLVLDPPRRIE